MTRVQKRLLVNLNGSRLTNEHPNHWAKLSAAGLVDCRPFVDDTHYVIRTAEGNAMARRLRSEDPSLVAEL